MKKKSEIANLRKSLKSRINLLIYILSAGFIAVLILTAVLVNIIRESTSNQNTADENTFLTTGEVIWASDWCTYRHRCPAGEGDCDKDTDCLTDYCAQNVGAKYSELSTMDVCECVGGKVWNGLECADS